MPTTIGGLRPWFEALQLNPDHDREAKFFKFVKSWLRDESTAMRPPPIDPDPQVSLNRKVHAFLSTYGDRLWPSFPHERRHLTADSNIFFSMDGQDPNDTGSPLVQAVRMYLDQAIRFDAGNQAADTATTDELFDRVIAADSDAASQPASSG